MTTIAASPLYFAFRGRNLVVLSEGARLRVPDAETWPRLGLRAVRQNDLGLVAGRHVVAVELDERDALPESLIADGLRKLHSALGEEDFKRAGRAVQIVEWDRSHRFCGGCGAPTERVPNEFAKRCGACGIVVYPRISPAIIVLVERGDQALLAQHRRTPIRMYTTLAGFVEAGESLEEAVVREVHEETGIAIGSLRYFGSQAWPFPDSLMLGFHATYVSGEIKLQEAEIADASWFSADALPPIPPRGSIARRLIADWVQRQGRDPEALP